MLNVLMYRLKWRCIVVMTATIFGLVCNFKISPFRWNLVILKFDWWSSSCCNIWVQDVHWHQNSYHLQVWPYDLDVWPFNRSYSQNVWYFARTAAGFMKCKVECTVHPFIGFKTKLCEILWPWPLTSYFDIHICSYDHLCYMERLVWLLVTELMRYKAQTNGPLDWAFNN